MDQDKTIKIFILFMFLIGTFLFLGQVLRFSEGNCNIVACQYEGVYYTSLVILVILGFPSFLYYLIPGIGDNLSYIIISQVLLISWNFLLAFLILKVSDFSRNFLMKRKNKLKSRNKKLGQADDNPSLILNLVIYLNFLFFIFMIFFGLFFYPKVAIETDINDYLLVTALLVAILTLFLSMNRIRNKEVIVLEKGLVGFSLALIFLSTIGMLFKFIDQIKVVETGTLFDLASINAFNLGIFGSLLMGLFSTMFLILYSYSKIFDKPLKSQKSITP